MLVLTRHPYVLQASAKVHNAPHLLLHSLHFPQTEDSSPSSSYNVSIWTFRSNITSPHINHTLIGFVLDWQTHRCISVLWISTINNNVTRFKKRNLQYMGKKVCYLITLAGLQSKLGLFIHGDVYQFIDEVIDSLSSLDEEDDATRFFEFRHHVFKGLGPDHLSAFGFIV